MIAPTNPLRFKPPKSFKEVHYALCQMADKLDEVIAEINLDMPKGTGMPPVEQLCPLCKQNWHRGECRPIENPKPASGLEEFIIDFNVGREKGLSMDRYAHSLAQALREYLKKVIDEQHNMNEGRADLIDRDELNKALYLT